MKSKVVVSRKWHSPEIETRVDAEGISMHISLDDFLRALIEESFPPQHRDQALETLRGTTKFIVEEIKRASVAVL